MSRVVVVGGGFGGTAAAARLAKLGHDVTVVERLDRLGGAVGTVERDGFRWDSGPTSTALPAVLRDLFRKSGRPLERELELVPVEPMREHRFADGTVLALPSGSRSAQLDAVDRSLGAGRGRQWLDYVHGHAEAWDLLRRAFLEHPYSPDTVDRRTRALLRTRTSLHRVVSRAFADQRLRELAVFSTGFDGHDPRRVPWWMGMWAYVEQNFGRWTVPGGLGALAATMTKRLAERKVQVLLGTAAQDLLVRGGRVVGVHTDQGSIDADVVVCAVDPGALPALAPYAARSVPAMPPMVSHLGLAGEIPRLAQEVVLHGDPLLVVRTNGTAPSGGAAWTVLVRGRAEDPLDLLARHGIDVRRRLQVRVDRSPHDQVDELAGSAYGALWQGRGSVDRRLARLPVEGVYPAGVHAAAGAELASVGLTASVVAQQVGPA
jgi:phytoene dehydrogenase-like protein